MKYSEVAPYYTKPGFLSDIFSGHLVREVGRITSYNPVKATNEIFCGTAIDWFECI